MTNRAQMKYKIEIGVGLLVLLGVLALMALAIQISGLTDIYNAQIGPQITADFENIGGLKVRSRVTLNGVPIGRVTNIVLKQDKAHDEGSLYMARVTFILKKGIKIPADLKASIFTAGLLGDNYIALDPGYSKADLRDGDHIDLENTHSALILENLISSFVSKKASQE